MLLPPIVRRREMDRNLVEYFRHHGQAAFRRAITDFCGYYHLRRPRIEWYEYIDWGKSAGRTFEDGRIHLVHPENWKRGRIYKSERMWVQAVYHELAHYLFWTDAERKAETFTRRMVRGLRRPSRRARPIVIKLRIPKTRRTTAAPTKAIAVRAQASRSSARRSRNDRASTARRGGALRGRPVRGKTMARIARSIATRTPQSRR